MSATWLCVGLVATQRVAPPKSKVKRSEVAKLRKGFYVQGVADPA